MESLKEKIVFVTGASSGIGKACAIEFAKKEAHLILCARNIDALNIFADELKTEYGIKVYAGKLDVRNREDVSLFVSALPDEWKQIDILVNNAGLARGLAKIYEDDINNWEEMIDTNIKGLLYVSRAVVPLMVKRNKGHVINIGSIAGHETYPKGGVYCGTKHAVDAITKSMRMDLLEHNVKVSTVDPGLVDTNFSPTRFHGDKDKAKSVYKGIDPLTGKDIAETVIFIATRPQHVNIGEIIVLPSSQASTTIVFRKE